MNSNGYFTLSNIALLQTADQILELIRLRFKKELNYSINQVSEAFILKFRNCESYLFGRD